METEIIKINSFGDGSGIFNKKKVFIPKTCIGEIVEFEIIEEHKDYINGKLIKVKKESSDRVNDVKCPFYEKCGGCNLLHLTDNAYYNFKEEIIKDTIIRSGYNLNNFNFIKIPFGSRRRVVFKVDGDKLGFFERGTNKIAEISSCLLIEEEINNFIPILNDLIKKVKVNEISVTSYENGLEIIFSLLKNPELTHDAAFGRFMSDNDNIATISYKVNDEEPILLFQRHFPELTLMNGIKLELVSSAFLQATLQGQNAITSIIVEEMKNYANVADLYCGVGTYTFPLSNYVNVHSVEGNQKMVNMLRYNAKLNNLENRITTECRDLVSKPLSVDELNKYDALIINPPRNGAGAQCKLLSKSNVEKIIMVSCNPITFISDSRELNNKKYKLTKITGIDQFYKTPHLEIVGIFEKY